MEYLLFWVVLSVVVGIIAGARGRSGFGYFILSLLLSPLVGLLLAVCLPSQLPPTAAGPAAAQPAEPTMRCPDCAEVVLAAANKCKHCGADLTAHKAALAAAAAAEERSAWYAQGAKAAVRSERAEGVGRYVGHLVSGRGDPKRRATALEWAALAAVAVVVVAVVATM